LVVTATGDYEETPDLRAGDIKDAVDSHVGVDVVEATAPGGLYLDQETLAREGISENVILAAISRLQTSDGTRVFADVFTSIAVTFERYC
jgi:hypothetical protein